MEIVKKAADHIPQIVKIAADPTHQIAEKVAEKVEYISILDPGIYKFNVTNDIHGKNNTVAKNATQLSLAEPGKESKNIDPNIDTNKDLLVQAKE